MYANSNEIKNKNTNLIQKHKCVQDTYCHNKFSKSILIKDEYCNKDNEREKKDEKEWKYYQNENEGFNIDEDSFVLNDIIYSKKKSNQIKINKLAIMKNHSRVEKCRNSMNGIID